ncbi:MAG: hypothetical protein HYU03_00455 [Thaumarchaeota archaeon]|nr:hypothetical protein [Nitrososphaerota archaeon]
MNSDSKKLKITRNVLSPKMLIASCYLHLLRKLIRSFGWHLHPYLAEQYGVAYSIAGGFTGADNGFSSSTTQAASAQPCTWTNGGIRRSSMPVDSLDSSWSS